MCRGRCGIEYGVSLGRCGRVYEVSVDRLRLRVWEKGWRGVEKGIGLVVGDRGAGRATTLHL